MRTNWALALIFMGGSMAGAVWLAARPHGALEPQRLQICATISPLADWAREVGGADARVYLLVDGYKDPHHFEPTVSDAVRVSASRALLASGLGLDPWAEQLVEHAGKGAALEYIDASQWIQPLKLSAREIEINPGSAANQNGGAESFANTPDAQTVPRAVRDAADALRHAHGHNHGGDVDPHFWHDPRRAMQVVAHLVQEFGRFDPAHKDAYVARGEICLGKLKALDARVEAAAKKIPAGTRVVTFHDAYGYLFERLHVKVAAVVQTSPGVEPSLKDCAEALRVMREIKQPAIFKEPASSERAIDMIAHEMKIEHIALLDPLDNGDSPVGRDYFERMEHNIATLESVWTEEKR